MEAVRNSQRNDDTHSRLSVLENNMSIISHNVEKLEYQIDQNYATLHSRISDLRDDLRSDFESKNERIIEKLEEHNKNSAHQSEVLQTRISQIEKWRWMIMGAALVIGYVLAHIKVENFF